MLNDTGIPQVFLVGFPGVSEDHNALISSMMFIVYVISLTANGSVVCLVILHLHLHHPMYLILAHLAASNLLFDTVTLPKLIAKYWFGASYMSYNDCLFQMFCVHYCGSLDSFLLMVMAIDRLISIYHPLRYVQIMTNSRVLMVCGFCWVFLASSIIATITIQAALMVPCPPQRVYSLFCTHASVMAMSCTYTAYERKVAFVSSMIVLLLPFGVILLSYVLIIAVISSRSESLRKALYTCTTHLIVVGLYYAPRIFLYIVSNITFVVIPPDINVLLLFLYSVVPHMANPIIYFLNTKEIRQTLRRVLRKLQHKVQHSLC